MSYVPTSRFEEIEKQLNKGFENVSSWFADSKLSIHFGWDKTRSILFASKQKIKSTKKLNTTTNTLK